MAWIRVGDEGEADEELRRAHAHVGVTRGKVAHIMRVHSLHPETMVTHLEFYRSLMFGRSPPPAWWQASGVCVIQTYIDVLF